MNRDNVVRVSYIERRYTVVVETDIATGANGADRVAFSALVGDLKTAKRAVKALGLDTFEIEVI